MPRDASGNYTLPPGNPVISGTVITADWANDTMPDIGNEITDSLSRSGQGGMLVPLEFGDGSTAAPSITFTNEISLGLFRASAGILGISGLGINVAVFDANTGNVAVGGAAPLLDADLTRKDYVDAGAFGNFLAGYQTNGTHQQYVADLDDIAVNSVYLMRASVVLNPPSGMGTDWAFVETLMFSGSAVDATQTIIGQSGASIYRQWQRTQAANVWSAWKLVIDGGSFTQRFLGFDDTGFHLDPPDLDADLINHNSSYRVSGTTLVNGPVDFTSGNANMETHMTLNDQAGYQKITGQNAATSFKVWMRIRRVSAWEGWVLVTDGLAPTIFYSHADSNGVISRDTGDWTIDHPSNGLYNYLFNVTQPNTDYNIQATIASSSIGFLTLTGISVNGFTITTYNAASTLANRGVAVVLTRKLI